MQEPLLVQMPEVAGMEPAIAQESLGLAWSAEETGHHRGAANHDLADPSRRDVTAVGVHDPDEHAPVDGYPEGPGAPAARVVDRGGQRLAQPVALERLDSNRAGDGRRQLRRQVAPARE